jgi:hypothetical protein
MKAHLANVNPRQEAICIALAAAEVCWAAPVVLAAAGATNRHPPLLLWLGMLALLLGFFYAYRALVQANLSLRLQQSLLLVALLLSVGLLFRFHVYAHLGLEGIDWLLEPFRRLADLESSGVSEVVAIFAMLYLWVRGIQLARRSLTVDAVGFTFRAGVVIFIWSAFAVALFTNIDPSGFIAPFFFFGLVAVALARIEEVSRVPGSSRAPGSGVWIGSAVAVAALVVLLGSLVAVFFSGGSLEHVLRFLSPLMGIVQILVIGLALLIFGLLEFLLSVFRVDLSMLRRWMQEFMDGLWLESTAPPLTGPEAVTVPEALGTVRAGIIVALIVVLVGLVLLFTWWRVLRDRDEDLGESRESLLSASAVLRNLLDMLRSGRDRLGQMAGLVDRFGLGSRLLSAISIQRIYANLVRLATRAGYPRIQAQTPYEYLLVLCEVWPDNEADMAVITDAYVNAHYGQVPDTREELDRIRECWERVRSRAAVS